MWWNNWRKIRDYSVPIKQRHSGPCGPMTIRARLAEPAGLRNRGEYQIGYMKSQGGGAIEDSFLKFSASRVEMQEIGWYCDPYQHETIHGFVLRLAKGRGFLAGATMGEGMVFKLDRDIFDDEGDVMRHANYMAQRWAEEQMEYEASQDQEVELDIDTLEPHETLREAAEEVFRRILDGDIGITVKNGLGESETFTIDEFVPDKANIDAIVEEALIKIGL